ncbi:MAG: hypothetical protein QMB08_06440 [Acidimicrobiales bacterium]|jgi:MFS family permease
MTTGEAAQAVEFDADAVERWFVQRGVPQAIFHYNAAEDVLTRMVPYLTAVFLLGALAGFGDKFTGRGQFGVALAAFGILMALAVASNRLRGRRNFELPDNLGRIEIALFLLGAPFVAVLFGDLPWQPVWLLLLNLVMLGLGYVATTYGAVPMLRWGVREVGVQVRGVLNVLSRLLPLLLLFATFLFLNAEVWQVAHGLTWQFYIIVIAMVLVPAVLFLALRSPDEITNLHSFSSWAEIDEICHATDAPLWKRADLPKEKPQLVPLDEGERRNLALLMLAAQLVQTLLVALGIGLFFVAFGLFTVREETLLQWTEISAANFDPLARLTLFGAEVVITPELFAVSGFIAAISALQFAVSLNSDATYRKQFYASLEREIREVLAVRARYLYPMVQKVLTTGAT